MRQAKIIIGMLFAIFLLSCTTMVKNLTDDLAEGVMQQKDLQLIKEGAPAYLLIIESLIYNNPDQRDYLLGGIQTFSSYSGAFVNEPARQAIFKDKVTKWGNALLNTYPAYRKYDRIPTVEKEAKEKAYTDFIQSIKKKDVPYLFWGFYGQWSGLLSGGLSDPSLFMLLPRVVALAEKIYQLDDRFMGGMPHLFFGVYHCAYPEAFGGSFEKGKKEFDEAIGISEGKMLLFKVLYAEFYYKPQYDREGYKTLLKEVLEFDLDTAPDLWMMNWMAQEQARKLWDDIENVFY